MGAVWLWSFRCDACGHESRFQSVAASPACDEVWAWINTGDSPEPAGLACSTICAEQVARSVLGAGLVTLSGLPAGLPDRPRLRSG